MAAVLATTWIYVVALPIAFLDEEYPRWIAKEDLLAKCELGATLVLGDSRATVDLLPAQLPGPVTNLALAGTTPVEMYFALRRALRCPVLPKRVILSFSPSHFLAPDLFWGKTVRYRFLNYRDLMELYTVSERLGDMSVIGSGDDIDKLPTLARIYLYTSEFPSVYFNSLIQGRLFGRYRSNLLQENEVFANRGQYFFLTAVAPPNEIAAEAFINNFNPPPVIDYYFRAAIKLLQSHNIPTIYATMPINYSTFVHMKPGIVQSYHIYVKSIIEQYPVVRWIGEPLPSCQIGIFRISTRI